MSDTSSTTKQSSIFGLDRWVLVGIAVGASFVLVLVLISLWLASKRSKKPKPTIPIACKEIQEIKLDRTQFKAHAFNEPNAGKVNVDRFLLLPEEDSPAAASSGASGAGKYHGIHIDIGKENRISFPGHSSYSGGSSGGGGGGGGGGGEVAAVAPEVSHLGWGHWYTLRELELSTNGFADENVIGEGGYGIVYHAVFDDKSQVAVKNLLNNRGQAEREFKVEVEAIGRVRHKNLVRLLGYCAEGAHRMLVYEYVNNGNLEQWLHGDVGPQSPLTWDIRMNIILGTAKGYVAPEYASTGMLNERSDVYSFGILIMEIISGRNPVDYSRPKEEDRRAARQIGSSNSDSLKDQKIDKSMIGSSSSRRDESIEEKSPEISEPI
ncbi:hypothetical protein ACFE04_001912 [Oxalis oulophora]